MTRRCVGVARGRGWVRPAAVLCGALSSLVFAREARAQSSGEGVVLMPMAPQSAVVVDGEGAIAAQRDVPRLRLGLGGHLGFGLAGGVLAGGVGPAIDGGLQLGDRAAVYLSGRVATVVLLTYASLSAIGEWSPNDRVSLGAGLGVLYATELGLGHSRGTNALTGQVPLLLGLHFGSRAATDIARSQFRLGLELVPNWAGGTSFGVYGGLTLAWARR